MKHIKKYAWAVWIGVWASANGHTINDMSFWVLIVPLAILVDWSKYNEN